MFLSPILPFCVEGAHSCLRGGGHLARCDAQLCISCTAVPAGRQGGTVCASAAITIASRQELSPSHLDGVTLDFVLAEPERGILQICLMSFFWFNVWNQGSCAERWADSSACSCPKARPFILILLPLS